jgi:hypothetical protein
VRRLTRQAGTVRAWRVRPHSLSAEDLRRVSYHLRARRGVANFARCWLLVEGETEYWLLPELARIAGHDFAIEGVACVEFAQCGLPPLIKLAREFGIEWHLLTDGDAAGEVYASQAMRFVRDEPAERRITVLPERDIENCFYEHGYARCSGDWPAAGRWQGAVRSSGAPSNGTAMLALECLLAAPRRIGRRAAEAAGSDRGSVALTREAPCTTQTHFACSAPPTRPPDRPAYPTPTRYLERFFNPKSIAVISASERRGASVARWLKTCWTPVSPGPCWRSTRASATRCSACRATPASRRFRRSRTWPSSAPRRRASRASSTNSAGAACTP